MLDKIKRLGSDTAVYGVSTILGRFLSFLLTPFYANMLAPGELGVVATVFAYIAFLNVVYGYGMESAYFKYAASKERGDDRQNFSIPFLSVLASTILFSLLLVVNASPVAALARIPAGYERLVRYSALILATDAIAVVPFAVLRLERKAVRFASIRIAGIVVNVGMNILFLIHFRMGIEGIFISNVISSGLLLLLLVPTILSHLTFRWDGILYRALLKFGLPNVPAGIAAMMIQVIDRPILEALTDKATVGIYQANYRLGVFMMLIVSTYDFAWRPFFLSHADDPEARPLFARILTYYTLLMSAVFLALSLFLEDIVKIPLFWGRSVLPEPYWSGLSIVPVVLLGYLFLGMSNNMVAGIYIQKKTHYLPPITFVGAATNVVVNYLLIPPMGLMGAAVATLLSYAVMTGMVYVIGRRVYPVKYETARLLKIATAAAIVFALYRAVDAGAFGIAWKTFLLLVFFGLMYAFQFFNPAELRGIMAMARVKSGPEKP
jgi:O-antigen/teichoic acid export membrane protein